MSKWSPGKQRESFLSRKKPFKPGRRGQITASEEFWGASDFEAETYGLLKKGGKKKCEKRCQEKGKGTVFRDGGGARTARPVTLRGRQGGLTKKSGRGLWEGKSLCQGNVERKKKVGKTGVLKGQNTFSSKKSKSIQVFEKKI